MTIAEKYLLVPAYMPFDKIWSFNQKVLLQKKITYLNIEIGYVIVPISNKQENKTQSTLEKEKVLFMSFIKVQRKMLLKTNWKWLRLQFNCWIKIIKDLPKQRPRLLLTSSANLNNWMLVSILDWKERRYVFW